MLAIVYGFLPLTVLSNSQNFHFYFLSWQPFFMILNISWFDLQQISRHLSHISSFEFLKSIPWSPPTVSPNVSTTSALALVLINYLNQAALHCLHDIFQYIFRYIQTYSNILFSFKVLHFSKSVKGSQNEKKGFTKIWKIGMLNFRDI